MIPVALAHDYATQRGGAERVALMLAQAFPGAPMYTTLYDPAGTFPEFASLDLRPGPLNHVAALRHNHRAALPLLASAVDSQLVEAEVLVASSTGWAHGYRGAHRTVVYCHAPARWLYQRDRYLGARQGESVRDRARRAVAAGLLDVVGPGLRVWDSAAARRADAYLVNSTVTQRMVREAYGIEAEVLPAPPAVLPGGHEEPLDGVEPGYLLCVARLLPYKNVDAVIGAALQLDLPLVVVGAGPDRARLEALAQGGNARGGRVIFAGRVSDAQLRWAYRNASLLVAASYEDYGLSPLEAAGFGVPTAALRDGGYLDTVVEGVTGAFFDVPSATNIARTICDAAKTAWKDSELTSHVAAFGLERFVARLQDTVGRPLVGAAAS